ncbi:MAG: ArgE/DapE family deacylase [Aerococcus sp.]|nr:ArgE/DapE family deacylase [Aerococcus sp.]
MSNEEALELLKQLIDIETVNGNEREVVDALAEQFDRHDIPVEIIPFTDDPNRAQLVAILEGDRTGKTFVFSGHMDVVPVSQQEWQYEPFRATVDNGILYGRGASDMKSGLAAEAVALIRLKEARIPFAGTIKFIATAAEEVGLLGAESLAKQGYIDDVDAMVIGEPTSLAITQANKGVFDFIVRTHGKAAHSSEPNLGVNAIDHLILTLHALYEQLDITDVRDDVLGQASVSLNQISGGITNNIVPDEAEAFIDIRTVAGQDPDILRSRIQKILTKLQETVPNYQVDYEQIYDILAVSTPSEHPLISVAKKVVGNHGYDAALHVFRGATDASKFRLANKDFGMIILGPGNGSSAHQVDENVKVADYYQAIEIYQEIATDYLNHKE